MYEIHVCVAYLVEVPIGSHVNIAKAIKYPERCPTQGILVVPPLGVSRIEHDGELGQACEVFPATRHLEARTQLSLHLKSSSSGTDTPTSLAPAPLRSSITRTRRSGSPNGKGCKSTAFTTLKIAVVPPMPRAIVNTAMAVKPGDLRGVPRSGCAHSIK